MVWKIFSPTQELPVYVVCTRKKTKGDLILFIYNRGTGKQLTVDETQVEEVKAFLKEIFKLDIKQFIEIAKRLNQKYEAYKYATKLLENQLKAYEGRIALEEYNLEILKGKEGERARLQRRLAEIMIKEIQEEMKKRIDVTKVKKPNV